MFSCELEKDDNGKEVLKWHRIDETDDADEENDKEMNVTLNSMNKLSNEENKQQLDVFLSEENTKTSLYDLYPPEKISGSSGRKEETTNRKLKLEDENEIIDYGKKKAMNSSRISNKSQVISAFDIDEDDSPLNTSKNENFGIALTGNVFEKLFKLNQQYIKKKDKKLQNIHSSYRLVLKMGEFLLEWHQSIKLY